MRHLFHPIFTLCVLSLVAGVTGCTRSERDQDLETLSARELALGYHIIDDALREIHNAALSNSNICDQAGNAPLNSCLQGAIFNSNGSFPKTLTLDYGQENNVCDDGLSRYGVIRARFTGKYLETGTVVDISFQDYRREGYSLSADVSLECLGPNSDGTYRFSWTVTEANITGINTDFDWEGEHIRFWTAGNNGDGEFSDDAFRISGIATGRNSRGNTFTNEITSNYLSDPDCHWFTKGRSQLAIPNLELRTLNFGENDSCNNIVIERRNNTYFEVQIP